MAFLVAVLTVTGAIALWIELVVREAAVYVIVLMLPLFFAALVWPARRVWAARAVELLIALILSKFVIVAVLALGGAAMEHAAALSITSLLAGLALVLLAAFSPWVLLRLLPLHEMASAAAAGFQHSPFPGLRSGSATAAGYTAGVGELVEALPSRLSEMAAQARGRGGAETPSLPPPAPDAPGDEPRVSDAAEEAAAAVAASGSGAAAPAADPGAPPGDDSTTNPPPPDEPPSGPPDLWQGPEPTVALGPEMLDHTKDGSTVGSGADGSSTAASPADGASVDGAPAPGTTPPPAPVAPPPTASLPPVEDPPPLEPPILPNPDPLGPDDETAP